MMEEALSLAESLGMNGFELKSLTEPTLCIVKSDATIHVAMPDGLVEVGSASDPDDLKEAARLLAVRQNKTYGANGHE